MLERYLDKLRLKVRCVHLYYLTRKRSPKRRGKQTETKTKRTGKDMPSEFGRS